MIKDFSIELGDVNVSEKSFFTCSCHDFSDCFIASTLYVTKHKAITTFSYTKSLRAETLIFPFFKTGARPQ